MDIFLNIPHLLRTLIAANSLLNGCTLYLHHFYVCQINIEYIFKVPISTTKEFYELFNIIIDKIREQLFITTQKRSNIFDSGNDIRNESNCFLQGVNFVMFFWLVFMKIWAQQQFTILLIDIIQNIQINHPFMKSKAVLFALFVLVASIAADSNYRKIIHGTDPEAKCLDGSGPMIYLHEGGDTKNILFYFIGGGACMGTDLASTLDSCYRRSKGMFGTSKVWPDTYNGTNGGILETDPAHSRFANWTKIVIMYCDGAFHQGNNKNAIKYKDTELYFRGAVNTRSHIKWAHDKYDLTKAEKIIVSGSSAGGMATYLWVDSVRSLVPSPQKVYGVADSGVFYDPLVNNHLSVEENVEFMKNMFVNAERIAQGQEPISGPRNADPNPIQILLTISNVDERPPNKQCSALLDQDQVWKCIFIQFSYATLKQPILFIESSYDQFVIQEVYGFKCLSEGKSGYTPSKCSDLQMNAIELYRSLYIDKFVPNLLKWGHSLWSISCVWHAEMINGTIYDSPLQKVPKDNGPTMRQAAQNFVFQQKRVIAVDLFPWPANTPCAY